MVNFKNKPSLSAIVPVYNEEKFIETSLTRLLELEIIDTVIVVDDCSTDATFKILLDIQRRDKRIDIVQMNSNSGKGSAISSVFDSLKTDYAIIHDADLEYDPKDVYKLYKNINSNRDNFILGTRFNQFSKPQLYKRTFYANKFLSFLFSVVHNKKISDVATCYKLMPSIYLKNNTFNETGFTIEIELLAKFLKISPNYEEVPITYNPRSYGDGKKIKFVDGFKYIYTIIKYKFK